MAQYMKNVISEERPYFYSEYKEDCSDTVYKAYCNGNRKCNKTIKSLNGYLLLLYSA